MTYRVSEQRDIARYATTADPSKLAFMVDNLNASGNAVSTTIWIRTFLPEGGEVDVPIYTASGIGPIKWSHSGGKFTFHTGNGSSSYGGIWTIHSDGSGLTKVKSNNGTTSYSPSCWSPDDSEIVISSIKDRGFGVWYYNIQRMPVAGGTLINLTGDLRESLGKFAEAWVPLGP